MYHEFLLTLDRIMERCCNELNQKGLGETKLCRDLQNLLNRTGNWKSNVSHAPLLISEALHLVYGRPVIVLVDEYEAPLNHALKYGYLTPASDFFGIMFSKLLKASEFLQ